MYRLIIILVAACLAAPADAQRQDRTRDDIGPKTIIGPRNVNLQDGASALMAGRAEEGVRLTLKGLEDAAGAREEEAALSNLCAGYIMMEKYAEAKRYCDLLLARNDKNWRGYNNRAVIYIKTREYDKAEQDLERGEALRPNAHTLKVARAMYMDAVYPVSPEVIVDDRGAREKDKDDGKQ